MLKKFIEYLINDIVILSAVLIGLCFVFIDFNQNYLILQVWNLFFWFFILWQNYILLKLVPGNKKSNRVITLQLLTIIIFIILLYLDFGTFFYILFNLYIFLEIALIVIYIYIPIIILSKNKEKTK